MQKIVDKTTDVLTRFGEKLERRLSTGDDESEHHYERPDSPPIIVNRHPEFRRPLDQKYRHEQKYSSRRKNSLYDRSRNYSADHLAASPAAYSSFNNYRQNPMENPMGNPYANPMMSGSFGNGSYGAGGMNYGGYPAGVYGGMGSVNGNVGYAPEYYVAERRQLELVPAPPPRVIQQPVPIPVPVDRPVPQPYAVQVPCAVPVDRPVPVRVPVPTPVPVDRPVYVPVPVASAPPPPVQIPVPVPVPVPTPVPQYVPVSVPVPSPPPSPVMIENSVTHTQRWVTSAPGNVSQQSGVSGSPIFMNQQQYGTGSPVFMNQQRYGAGSPVFMNQQRYGAGSPAMGANPCVQYPMGSAYY